MTHSEIEEQDIIDLFLLRKLPPEVEAEFADHFMTCPQCLEQLESSRQSIALIQEGFAAGIGREQDRRVASGRRRFALPLPVWGLAAGLSLAALTVTLVRRPSAPNTVPNTIEPGISEPPAVLPVVVLPGLRTGSEASARLPGATVERGFVLRLDVRGVDPFGSYSIVAVAADGRVVWSRTVERNSADWLEVRVEAGPFQSGNFWVRLSGIRPDGTAEPLREYSLAVER